jgi:hypothetical protein
MSICSKNGFFGTKSTKILPTKTFLAEKSAIFLELLFSFVWLKDKLNMCKITILSLHAMLEKLCRFCQEKSVLEQKAAELHIHKYL